MSERIFALDIGTRSVVGIILENNQNQFRVIDFYVEEHKERSMLDGQIHDVVSVANVITSVKTKLEKKHNITLTKVCVAAAGRALKTKRTSVVKDISQQPIMEKEDILFLELSAVQKAQYALAIEEESASSAHYYCVGYSVLQYQLDNELIGSLIDQQGDNVTVEIIATFLPKVVVESLISALQRAGLEMEALTLEPIAAINVLIPISMRRLNVALVDIGAGTSDIALTAEGTITAYGMVPLAGDEITEAISDYFLLDFPEAENVKKQMTVQKKATFTDILGFEQTIDYEAFIEAISPSIDSLVRAISKEIHLLNNKSPKAVMLVGGGSLTPELTNRLAEALDLPYNRVAIRGVDAVPALEKDGDLPIGPEYITPIGIAIAAKQNPVHYISVTVNERVVRLFDMKQLTVGDCLLAAGINIDKLYGRPGMAYIINWNGKDITIPGTYGSAPKLWCNDNPITVKEPIKHGDILRVEKGLDGLEPKITLNELIGDLPSYHVTFNDFEYELHPAILVNNNQVHRDYLIKDHDNITVEGTKTINDLLTHTNNDDIKHNLEKYTVWINSKKHTISSYDSTITLNGRIVNLETVLTHGDIVRFETNEAPTLRELLAELGIESSHSINIIYNGKPLTLTKSRIIVYKDGVSMDENDKILSGDRLQFKETEVGTFIFQDIFRFISLDLSKVKGGIEIKRNGENTTFYDELKPNDSISIIWKDKA